MGNTQTAEGKTCWVDRGDETATKGFGWRESNTEKHEKEKKLK